MNIWATLALIGNVALVLLIVLVLIIIYSLMILSSRISRIEEAERKKIDVQEGGNSG